jgi:hypothetical protein
LRAPVGEGANPSPSPAAASSDSVPQPSTTGTEPTATFVATAAPTASAVPRAVQARRAPWRVDWATLPRWWRAGVFGGIWSAALPGPQASVGARLGVGISVLYAELRAAAELARGRRLSDATEARFATQDVGLALCAQWGGAVRAGPCATATVLRSTGGSRSVPDANDRALPWSAAGISVQLGWRALAGLELMFETGVQLPLSARPRFTVEGIDEVALAAPVSVYARLGLGFRSTDVAREQ